MMSRRKLIFIILSIFIAQAAKTQVIEEAYTPILETLRIGPEPERLINMTERGHTLFKPSESITPDGVVIFFQRGKVPVTPGPPDSGSFDYEAFERNLAVLHISTGDPLDFFFDDTTMIWTANHIQEVLEKHGLKEKPVFSAGLSLGGTRTLKFAQYLLTHPDEYWLRFTAVAVVDAPLDMERMWYAMQRASSDNFHEAAADEGRWVSYLLEINLGGTPKEKYGNYVAYSPYTYTALNGGRAAMLKNMPVRAYHEPDIDWWIDNRRKSYYSMNSLDMAAMINDLKLLGNNDADLITTHNKRAGLKETSSPHTWSFVDNKDLISWFMKHADE
jgi:hypothetical protein